MKAKVNPFYRSVVLSVDNQELAAIFFDELDEWRKIVVNGDTYDVHFIYEPTESFRNRHAWLSSLVSVYLVNDYTDEVYYSKNLVTNVTLDT